MALDRQWEGVARPGREETQRVLVGRGCCLLWAGAAFDEAWWRRGRLTSAQAGDSSRRSGRSLPGSSSSGQTPPTASMAMAMSASGDQKPNATRVSTRILVLVDSTSAFEVPERRDASIATR